MTFVHDDADFDNLLRIVAAERGLNIGLVEKDYWVTHTLWTLHHQGFEVWFKGGTSLSKGFGLIERFSEDLDLKIEPGSVTGLLTVSNWKSTGTKATAERRDYFTALANILVVPGASIVPDQNFKDETHRGGHLRVVYQGRHLGVLPEVMRPFVLLEIGSAGVTPAVERDLTSWVHEKLVKQNQLSDFVDNRPRGVRCVHPIVTLLEKLDALSKRVPRADVEPAAFVRHYEDAARIIAAADALPALATYQDAKALVEDMLEHKQIAGRPAADDPALTIGTDERAREIRRAYEAIGPMYWGSRIDLDEACGMIRAWVDAKLDGASPNV